MIFSKVILYSLDVACLSTFIQEIFDTEIEAFENSILLKCEQVNFEVKEILVKGKKDAFRHGQALEFTLENQKSLSEIKQKIEFFCYRQKLEIENLIISSEPNFLLIQDPDGRNWRFSVKSK
jgi:hypothetical protein